MGESEQHRNIVSGMVDAFRKSNLQIHCADLHGYTQCDSVETHIPDIKAYDNTNNLWYFGEAETCESLRYPNTVKQIREFSNRIMRDSKKTIPLYIGIPSICEPQLRSLLTGNGLNKSNIHIWAF